MRQGGGIDQNESVAPEDEIGAVDQDESVETGDTNETEDQDASVETGDTDEAEDQDESDVPGDDEEIEDPSAPEEEEPSASDVTEDEIGADAPMLLEDEENKYEANWDLHGAKLEKDSSDSTKAKVTFWVNKNTGDLDDKDEEGAVGDDHYASMNEVQYEAYSTYGEAEANHITNHKEGEAVWAAGVGAVQLEENEDQTVKSCTIEINPEKVGAILYYFPTDSSAEGNRADRENHEHILYVNKSANGTLPPNVPVGFIAHFWDTEDENYGKIYVAWNNQNVKNVAKYVLSFIDNEGQLLKEFTLDDLTAASYMVDNDFKQVPYTVYLKAYNADGDASGAAYCILNLQDGQAYGEPAGSELIEELRKLYNGAVELRKNGNENKTYTEDSWTKHGEAVDNAEKVLQTNGPTIKEVKDAIKQLQNAKLNKVNSSVFVGGGDTWTDYTYHVETAEQKDTKKKVPDNGVVKEATMPSKQGNGEDAPWYYMIFTDVMLQKGLTYKISYDITSSVPNQKITTTIEQETSSNAYESTFREDVTTTSDWLPCESTFKSTLDGEMQLKFLLSSSSNSLCDISIRNLILKIVDESGDGSGDSEKSTIEKLKDAIDKYSEYKKDDYEDDGWDDFEEALKKAKEVVDKVDKGDEVLEKDIKDALDELEKAADKLTPKQPTNPEKPLIEQLKDAIKESEKELEKEDEYTKESVDKLKEELEKAKELVDQDPPAEDDVIKKAKDDLNKAKDDLTKKTPKDKLKDAIEKYEKELEDNEDEYTKESVSKLKEELKNSKDLLEKEPPAEDKDLEKALEDLEDAASKLTKKTPKDKLKDAIDEYEEKLKNEEDKYTKDSVDKLKEELDKSKELLDKDDAGDDEIEKALNDLKDAADNLKKKPNKDNLQETYDKYKDYKEDDYTEDSWKDFKDALDNAKDVLDDEDPSEDEIEKAINDLEDAAKDLVKKPTKDDLKDAIDKYKDKDKYKEEDYTDESWKDLEDALNKAEGVYNDENASDKDIEDALKNLEDAADNLVRKDREGLWIKKIPAQTYTGSAIKPVIRVYEGTTLLEEKTDYTISYKNNTNVGTAQVIVKGKRDYGKTHTEYFEIKPKRLSDDDITAADVCAVISAQGNVKDPKVTIKYGNKTLKNTKDYRIKYPSIRVSGTIIPKEYTIKVTGLGNYKGNRDIKYTVYKPADNAINMSKVKVALKTKTVDYNGATTIKPDVTVTYRGADLDPEKDYKVSYLNYDRVGKATVMVSAKLNAENQQYYGSKSVTYTVKGTPLNKKNLLIKDGEVEIKNKSYTYTGSEIKAENLTVTDVNRTSEEGKGLLVEGKDYDITYSKNINAGNAATITLTGKNGYSGKFVQKFKIAKKQLGGENDPDLKWVCADTAAYTKSKAVPTCTITYKGVALREKKDYMVKCANNNATGNAATITIKGKGNYEGSKEFHYTVTAPALDKLYVADIIMPKNVTTDKVKKAVKVYETSTGKALKAGTDYDKNSIKLYVTDGTAEGGRRDVTANDFTPATEFQAEITLQGNYKQNDPNLSTYAYKFHLYNKNDATFKVDKIGRQEYTGKQVTLNENQLVVRLASTKDKLKLGEDYSVAYSNNIERGKAKVTITGISPRCRGVKTVTFQIGTRNLDITENWFGQAVENATKTISDFFSNFFNK